MRTEEYTASGAGFTLTRYVFDSPEEEKQFHIARQEQLDERIGVETKVCRTCGNRSASFCEVTRKLQSNPFHTCDGFETPEEVKARKQAVQDEDDRRLAEKKARQEAKMEEQKLKQQQARKNK